MNFSASSKFTGLNVAAAVRTYQTANRLSVEQSAEVVLEVAQGLVPVRGGSLRESGHIEIEAAQSLTLASAEVIFDAPHAQFVEYGTGVIGEGSYPYDLPESGVPITGGWVYDYKNQDWQGMEAQPYARPALDQSRPQIVEIFKDNFASATKLLGKS